MRAHRHGERDRGQAVVELAFAVPVLLAVTVLAMWGVGVARASIMLADAARDIARAEARGERPPAFDPSISIERLGDAERVVIIVRRELRTPVLGGFTMRIEQQATALREPI